jgi:hypothetical protein
VSRFLQARLQADCNTKLSESALHDQDLDPTKIPGRQTTFNRVSAAPIKAEDQSLWTETPAEVHRFP